MSDPTINNRELANRCHVAQRTLNGTFTGLYSKFGIVGNGREKRTKLIDALRPEKD
jgi:hypothetical protein